MADQTHPNHGGGDLRALRISKGMRQRDLADRAGVSLHHLMKWERGLEYPPDEELVGLAAILGCPIETLRTTQRAYVDDATPGEGYTTAVPEDTKIFPRSVEPPQGALRVLDLFCGSGGFSYGFELTGEFAVTAGIDLMPDRIDTFRPNHSSAVAIQGDICSFPAALLEEEALGPDIIIGGPPCQGVSSIRPFRNYTEDDPRNNLMERFAEIVGRLRPEWFVLENVVGLITHQSGSVLEELLATFKDTGYTTDWRVINAALFGLPQNRERLLIVGNRDGQVFKWPEPTHISDYRTMAGNGAKRIHVDPLFAQDLPKALSVMEAIHDLPEVAAGEKAHLYPDDVKLTPYEKRMREGVARLTLHQATNHSDRMLKIIRHAGSSRAELPEGLTTSGYSSSYSRLYPDKPSVTLTVNFVHPSSNKCIHPYQDRALTPREGARLQGFPDRFEFRGTRSKIVKQIGNAVPPLLGEAIAKAILDQW